MTRISTEQIWRSSLVDVAGAQLRRHDAQEQISSGRRIQRVSDDASDAHRVLGMTAEAAALEQYLRAGDDAMRMINAQDAVLQSVLDRLGRVNELTIAAGNATLDGEARESVALQLEELRDELVQLANTTQGGRSLFGGFQSVAVDASGPDVALVGDGGQVMRRIGQDHVVTVSVDGGAVFGYASGRSMFDVIDDIVADTRSADVSSLSGTRTTEVEQLRGSVGAGLGTIGAQSVTVEATLQTLATERDRLTIAVGDIVNVDVAEATIAYSEANLAYEAALAVTAQVNRISILDYL